MLSVLVESATLRTTYLLCHRYKEIERATTGVDRIGQMANLKIPRHDGPLSRVVVCEVNCDGTMFQIVGDAWAGPGCIEYERRDGNSQPSMSSGVRHLIDPTDEVWLRFYLKLSKGWEWTGRNYHPHFMHLMITENSTGHGPAHSHLTFKGGYNGMLYDNAKDLFTDDQWHCSEACFKLGTLDLENDLPNRVGIVRGWFYG